MAWINPVVAYIAPGFQCWIRPSQPNINQSQPAELSPHQPVPAPAPAQAKRKATTRHGRCPPTSSDLKQRGGSVCSGRRDGIRQRPDDRWSVPVIDRSGGGVRLALGLGRSSPGLGSRHRVHRHRFGGGASLPAPLDQGVLGLVHRRGAEHQIPPLKGDVHPQLRSGHATSTFGEPTLKRQ